jgi:hypothetical protein
MDRNDKLSFIAEHLDTMLIEDRKSVLDLIAACVDRPKIKKKPDGSLIAVKFIPSLVLDEIYKFVQSTMVDDD